jgi:hypothetical protein
MRGKTWQRALAVLLPLPLAFFLWHLLAPPPVNHAFARKTEDTMFNMFAITIALPGTITADATFFFKVPCACTLREVCGAANNASTAQLNVGTKADPNKFFAAEDLGDSDTPAVYDLDDFDSAGVTTVGEDYPHLDEGDIVAVGLDVDGSTDPVDPCIVLWFQEG